MSEFVFGWFHKLEAVSLCEGRVVVLPLFLGSCVSLERVLSFVEKLTFVEVISWIHQSISPGTVSDVYFIAFFSEILSILFIGIHIHAVVLSQSALALVHCVDH